MWTNLLFASLLAHVCALNALHLPGEISPVSASSVQPKRELKARHIAIDDDCAPDEREYLQHMLYDIMDVFRHAAVSIFPHSRPITLYESEKVFEFFGTVDYQAREQARILLDEAARGLRAFPNGDPRIYCHAERFPEDERENGCQEGNNYLKSYSRRYLNEIALCPGWYSLPEYTETDDPNDRITILMLHLLQLLPYQDYVEKQYWWESSRDFPEWDYSATTVIRPKRMRQVSISPLRHVDSYSPRVSSYLYFVRSLWRREPVGPSRFHDWFPKQWIWMNGTEVENPPDYIH